VTSNTADNAFAGLKEKAHFGGLFLCLQKSEFRQL